MRQERGEKQQQQQQQLAQGGMVETPRASAPRSP